MSVTRLGFIINFISSLVKFILEEITIWVILRCGAQIFAHTLLYSISHTNSSNLFLFSFILILKFNYLTLYCFLRRIVGDGSSGDTEPRKKIRLDRGKKFNVKLTYAGKITMRSIQDVLNGEVSDHAQSALRVLDIILRHHAYCRLLT